MLANVYNALTLLVCVTSMTRADPKAFLDPNIFLDAEQRREAATQPSQRMSAAQAEAYAREHFGG